MSHFNGCPLANERVLGLDYFSICSLRVRTGYSIRTAVYLLTCLLLTSVIAYCFVCRALVVPSVLIFSQVSSFLGCLRSQGWLDFYSHRCIFLALSPCSTLYLLGLHDPLYYVKFPTVNPPSIRIEYVYQSNDRQPLCNICISSTRP